MSTRPRPILPRPRAPGAPESRVLAVLQRRRAPSVQPTAAPSGPTVVPFRTTGEPFLSSLLYSHPATFRASRPVVSLHVSDLLSKCIRRKALMLQLGTPLPSQRLSLMDELTYSVGDVIHDIIKAKAVAAGPSSAYGRWTCKCGKVKADEMTAASASKLPGCTGCGSALNVYDEITLQHPELGIVGHPDLVFYLAQYKAYYIAELKSISAEQYKELDRAKPDHIAQVVFYWWLMRELGRPVLDRVSVFYVTKGYVFKGRPYKEFAFDPQEHLGRLTIPLTEAREFAGFLKGGSLPTRRMCSSATCSEAKTCEVSSHCFGNVNAPTRVSFSAASSGQPTARR